MPALSAAERTKSWVPVYLEIYPGRKRIYSPLSRYNVAKFSLWGADMAEELERNSQEWLEEWERLQPLLEEWKQEHNPLLSEAITQSLKRLGLIVADASAK